VKQVGKDFAADPTVQPHLLETLKSQGVQRFADSAIVFRAKFKAVAGHQFVLRRNAYRRLIEAFAANEIRFAFPTVTISAGKGGEAPDEETLAAAARAVAAERTAPPPA
jgi:small-conductance mechanosensitive channel